ncbi:hypothetical protein PF007_g32794 [Phytophthora fragariae]|uniref:Secreted protein n=1 Tax=Phytophthora fragariae TaxID=53985 RepID=A0A6A3PJ87_9STRA|nr:hypothetical protein PF007_g32794 [Phytophthora fragariae]
MGTNTRAGSVLVLGGLSSTLSGAGNECIEWHYVRGDCCVWCGVAELWGRALDTVGVYCVKRQCIFSVVGGSGGGAYAGVYSGGGRPTRLGW